MNEDFKATIYHQVTGALQALQEAADFTNRHLLVIGASTSEVMGRHIGSSGTVEVAVAIYDAIKEFQQKTGVQIAFQCCEHLNRALVIDRETADIRGFPQVTVVPVRSAGGAMAAYAYQKMDDPVVVESLQADGGIDIGDTFIGMHLKSVVVPVRCDIKEVGKAHLTMARTRPKLIGGERAVYPTRETINNF